MSTSLIKYKDLALKVIYYTKTRQLGSKIFFATSKFQDVLQYFERNLKDSQTYLKSCYFLNGKQIYPSDTLLYFCTVDPSLRLVEEDMFLEIEELEHLDDASEPIYERLLKPLINPFRLIILNIKEGILQMVDFPKEKLAELGLDTLTDNLACCNSTDSLYLSCGKYLWIISHNNFQIEKKEMPFSKEKHSMAYIISNNTVFFVGGTQDSFYYDINSKEFISWGKMNGISEKPALLQFGDFLYSFNSFSQQGIYFEKTKLTNPAKKWEKLVPQSGDQESGFFYNQLFGVSKCSGGNVLFAGGINNQLRTFVYNLKANVLFITPSKDESILLNERNFYKIDHNFSIAIPTNIEKDHIVAIVNKNSKTLNLIAFEQIGVQTRNNLLQIDNPRNRLPGNLVIQCRYMALKDYENFLKSKEEQEANKTKGGFNIYNRKEQEKKLGDKMGGNNPYKYQYRGKTPLALERISEGRIEEEDEDDMKKEPKSSSAKKEKRSFDLGMKLENIGKFNFATQTREDKKVDSKNNSKNNKNNANNNKANQLQKENKENINLNNNNSENTKNNEEGELNKKEKNDLNLNSQEMVNKRNTYTEVKPSSIENIEKNKENKENKENNVLKESKNKEDKKEEIQNKIYSSETEVKRGNKKKVRQSREVRHKKINLNLDKKEEGKNNELNSSNLSSTPPSTLTDNIPISRNTNIQSNNQTDINKIKRDLNNTEASKVIDKANNINININLNNNNSKKIDKEENEENRKSNSNTPNSTKNKEKSIKKNNNNQNRIVSSSVNNNNMNINKNMNNNTDNNNISYNMANNEQKKAGNIPKNNNNIQNLKNIHQNINLKDNNNNTNIILKSNTTFSQKNQNMNNSLTSNPFIDNSKYQNIVEKETYQYREEREPNANKILTNKNTKSIKGIKKVQAQKKGYHTNTVTSMPLVDNQQILSESHNNNDTSQDNNFKMISYKTSTHKQIKGKRVVPLGHNSNNILMNINDDGNIKFSEIPKNLKNQHKKDLTPVQKNRNISGNKISAFYTEGNVKNINYSEQFIKFSNHKIQQDYSGQRQNTLNNISVSNSIYSNANNNNNNSLRILSNQRNISNEKLFKGNNTMRNNEIPHSKDGKKYVMAKNVQRTKKDEENGQGKVDERKKIYYSIND